MVLISRISYDIVNMILKPADAQNFLVRLVQALSPLITVREIAPSLFLMRRFFLPSFYPQEESLVDRHQITVLNTLHAMQKEVGEWVGETAQNQEPVKQPRAEETPPKSMPVLPSATAKKPVSLTRQAQELVHQVQEAITKLSSSTQIRAPQEEVLLKTLKELKPKLDRIVETLAERDVPPTKSVAPKAVPVSTRQEQFLEKPIEPRVISRKDIETKSAAPFVKGEKKSQAEETSLAATVFQKTEKTDLRPQLDLRFVTLPGAPHTAELKRLILNNKKKKRKGLWFRKDEDSRRDP